MAMIAIAVAVAAASAAIAIATSVSASNQQKTQINYQQAVAEQNKIAAQNEAQAKAKMVRAESIRQNAAAMAKMGASGIDASSGSFLDLAAQGANAGRMDELKALYGGEADSWSLNAKIGELETYKPNTALEAGLAGTGAFVSTFGSIYTTAKGAGAKTPTGAPTNASGITGAGIDYNNINKVLAS